MAVLGIVKHPRAFEFISISHAKISFLDQR